MKKIIEQQIRKIYALRSNCFLKLFLYFLTAISLIETDLKSGIEFDLDMKVVVFVWEV